MDCSETDFRKGNLMAKSKGTINCKQSQRDWKSLGVDSSALAHKAMVIGSFNYTCPFHRKDLHYCRALKNT